MLCDAFGLKANLAQGRPLHWAWHQTKSSSVSRHSIVSTGQNLENTPPDRLITRGRLQETPCPNLNIEKRPLLEGAPYA